MRDTIFIEVLNMSFTAGIVIAFVLLARLLLKKVPKSFSYALWSVVLFRLTCPFSFKSVISLLPSQPNFIPNDIMYSQEPQINTGIAIINDSINAVLPAATPYASMNPMQGYIFLGGLLWISGIVVLLVYSVLSLINLKSQLKDAVHERDNIFISASLTTPFVMGLIRPKIYLPTNLTAEEKQYIVLHEQTHIKRLDHVVKVLSFFVLCVHWFNPLVWVAFFLSGRDMEMSCDELVIKKMGNDVKKNYSSSLLSLATGTKIVGGTPLAFGEGDTKNRIKNVLNYKKPAFWVIIVAFVAIAIIIFGLISNPLTSEFYGSSIGTENSYTLDFKQLNSERTHKFNLTQGTVLNVEVGIKKGQIDFSVVNVNMDKGGEEIYKSEHMKLASFTVTAPFDGVYLISVKGTAAKGSVKVTTSTNADFTSAVMTEYVNSEQTEQVNFTDSASVNSLYSLLLIRELTNKESVNDAPNKESYIHISLEGNEKPLNCYIYEDKEKYYIEHPYNGIWEISADTLNEIMEMMTLKSRGDTLAKPVDVDKFLTDISQSFQIKEGVARFTVPEQMPSGYDISQLSVRVSGIIPMGDGSNMSLHAYEKADEERSWRLGEEQIERLFGAEVPDGTEVYASFYLLEKDSDSSKFNVTVSKIFPLRVDNFTPRVFTNKNDVIFTDKFNDTFYVTFYLPVGWYFKENVNSSPPATMVDIFNGSDEQRVGSVFYNNFKLYQDENGDIPYVSVYGDIMLGSMASWDNEYTEISKNETSCVATVKPWHNVDFPGVSNAGAATIYNKGILSYDANLQKYVAISLEDNLVDEATWLEMAKSVKLSDGR